MAILKTYKSKRHLIQFLCTGIIILLPFLNIFRLDIPALRFYFLNTILWIDEFYFLFLVAMLVLWTIVIFSMLYGRVWCGWMCPQTVLNEFIRWIENKITRWFKIPKNEVNLNKRLIVFGVSSIAAITISLLIGFNLVAYFVDPYRMIHQIFSGTLGSVTTGIIFAIASLVYLDIMFWREKFCTKACPYGMLQFVVTDKNTQIVRYQTERAEDCIECKACVKDCMMGIDIRESPYQTECIQCGDCVDSCSFVLGRLKNPKPTLISFSWGERGEGRRWFERWGLIDAKRWIVLGITVLFAFVLTILITIRQPLSVSVAGDRGALYRQTDGGRFINDYRLRISNRSMEDGIFEITCSDLLEKKIDCTLNIERNPLNLKSREVLNVNFSIISNGKNLNPGPNKLLLLVQNLDKPEVCRKTEIIFFMPEEEFSLYRFLF
jgi:cytochrome c oxidase accessory protein FixG